MLRESENLIGRQETCGREMTVVERLEFRRSNLIQELAQIESAIKEINRKDISNDLARVLAKLG